MPKDEWGVKRVCPSCDTRFYDLQRDPMTCPNCGAVFDLDSLTAKKTTARAEKKAAEAEVVVAETDDDADVVLDDDADADDTADVSVGDELLEDDEDDNVNLEEIADVPADDDDS